MTVIQTQLRKFSWGGNGATLGRLKATKIMVPTTVDSVDESVVDWGGISELGRELFTEVHMHTRIALDRLLQIMSVSDPI